MAGFKLSRKVSGNPWASRLHHKFWTEERGLTSMLVLLCIGNFIVAPLLLHELAVKIIFRIIWLALLFAGITALTRNSFTKKFLYIIPLLLLAVNTAGLVAGGDVFPLAEFIITVAAFMLLIGMVLKRTYEKGPVTIHRVLGAILAFMLIGNLGSLIFQYIYLADPGALAMPAVYTENGLDGSVFLYFSYTTLTTTGYGEITPVHPIARAVANLLQLTGVLYPAALIGRLVGLVVGRE